jgi:hypothetical protein
MLHGSEPQLVQPSDLSTQRRLVAEIRQRFSSPDRYPLLQLRGRGDRVRAHRDLRVLEESLESLGIDLSRLGVEDVAAGPCLDPCVAEHLP